MEREKLIQALRSERFRDQLSTQDRSALPAPAGIVLLSDSDLAYVVGGGVVMETGTGGPVCDCPPLTQTALSISGSCTCLCPIDSASP